MIFRISVVVVAAAAAIIVSHNKRQNSSINQNPEKDGSSLQQAKEAAGKFTDNFLSEYEEIQEEEEAASIDSEIENDMKPSSPCRRDCKEVKFWGPDKKLKNPHVIDLLSNLEKDFEERKLTLERKLLELYGLKERRSYVAQLQRKLEEKMAQMDILNRTVDSLIAERNDLEKELKEVTLAAKQLDAAKKTIEKMNRKLYANSDNIKVQLLTLQDQVSEIQSNNKVSLRDTMVEKKLKDVQLEFFRVGRKNKELALEKRELAVKLVAAQARIIAFSNLTESESIAKEREEISTLKHANEDLLKQVEELQKNRFSMVAELVYQRWLNTCMRCEIEIYKTPSRKPSQPDFGTNSQTKRNSVPNLDGISSSSSSMESSQRNNNKKPSIIHKLKKWRRSKENSNSVASPTGNVVRRKGLIRRFSTSMIPSKPSMLSGNGDSPNNTPFSDKKMENLNKSLETTSFRRARRVSFNDSISVRIFESTFEDVQESVFQKEEMGTEISSNSSLAMNASFNSLAELAAEERELSSQQIRTIVNLGSSMDVNEQALNKDNAETELDNKTRSEHSELQFRTPSVAPSENKGEIYMVVFFLCSFILLAYFLLASVII